MAATKLSSSRAGFRSTNAVIVLAETNQLTTVPGRLLALQVWNVGTTFTVDVYDTATAVVSTATHIWSWVSADGKQNLQLNLPLQAGLYVVTTGTPGGCNVVYA